MSSVLEDLWYGNIAPNEQCLNVNKKYKVLLPVMAKNREILSKDFTSEQSEWLEKYDDIINEMHSIAEVEAFKFGFKLATEFLFETL